MPTVAIENVTAGAVLARPVEDSMGRVLINVGETLTPQLISVLQKRGFAEVEIRAATEDPVQEAIAKRVTRSVVNTLKHDADVIKMREEIEKRFHNINPKNPRMQVIRLLAENVLVDKVAKMKGLA